MAIKLFTQSASQAGINLKQLGLKAQNESILIAGLRTEQLEWCAIAFLEFALKPTALLISL